MTKIEFDKLLEKYLKHQCTPTEKKIIDQWYEALGTTVNTEEGNNELETKLWRTIDRNINFSAESPVKQLVPQTRNMRQYILVGIAATITLVVVSGIFLFSSKTTEDPIAIVRSVETGSGVMAIKNSDNNVVKPVRLKDGSLVILQPKSEIQFNQNFGSDQRDVKLIGEAFFEIAKDASHPFLVHTEGLVTKVLGTSFNIKANPGDKNIVVDVKTGKVAVYRENNKVSKEEYHLTPNQQAIYFRSTGKILQKLQEDPQIIISEKEINEMKFDDTPVVDVFVAIEKAYGVDLVYDEDIFQSCFITTRMTSEGLYEKLQIICTALGATYEIDDTKVLLHGKGCE
jgi:transmembrane sensor